MGTVHPKHVAKRTKNRGPYRSLESKQWKY